MSTPTIFLLSPAHCGGPRAATFFRPEADFALARQLREPEGAPLGEVFSFVSGLYFRGKLAYARAFLRAPAGVTPTLVISSGKGLLPPETRISLQDITEFAGISVQLGDSRYMDPLMTDVKRLADGLPESCRVVLLGSIATTKYVELLLLSLGERLCFPEAFIGLGDMARGAMMLKASESGRELDYVGAVGAVRSRGVRANGRLGSVR